MSDLPGASAGPEELPLSVDELDNILSLQQSVFEMVARNDDYQTVINRLCSMAEQFLPDSIASVMLINEQGLLDVLSAPALPRQGREALAGLRPGPGGGSCGNAVYSNRPVYVLDAQQDPRWQDIRPVAREYNICACWSMPVRDQNDKAIGSFALTSFEPRSPSGFHKRLLEVSASIVSIVLSRRDQNKILSASRKRLDLLAMALQHSSDGVLITDADDYILETNQAFRQLSGYSEAELHGQNASMVCCQQGDPEYYLQIRDALEQDGVWSGEVMNRHKDGSQSPLWMNVSVIRNPEGLRRNCIAVFTDLSELKKGEEKLIRALEYDQLTGLPNRSKLGVELEQQPGSGSLLLLNVNNFSYINTAYGLELGDRFLQAIAERLSALERGARAFRINADEFALWFRHRIDLSEVIRRLQQYFFQNQIHVDALSFNITFTYGGASGEKDLLSTSLLAMKKAKEQGRNRFHIFSATEDEFEQEKRLDYMRWNSLLHSGLQEGCLLPWFQGIRDNRKGLITKFEALVRMEYEGQIYTPYQFLMAARLSGLMPGITRVMIDRSFAVMADRQETFSINITEEDLNHSFLKEYLARRSAKYSIDPRRVTLEILEGVSASGKKNHLSQLRALKACGYRLAIDDFGTEYSNFERILELEVDYIKIDSRFIRNIDQDQTSYEVTRAIVFFARNAGIETIAEFVHSAAVQQIVEELGIDYSQGYLYSKPVRELPAVETSDPGGN